MALPESVSRRRFLETAAALAGVSLLAGCSSSEEPDAGGPPPGGKGNATGPQASENTDGSLQLAGFGTLAAGRAVSFILPDGKPALLFQDAKGTYGAVSATCTHAGCNVEWREKEPNPLVCPCHSSKFDLQGAPKGGPAKKPLTHYAVVVTGDSAKLTPT